jgi:uncharacterized membrane protein
MGIALLAAVVYLANPVQLWGRLQQASPWWLLGGFGISIASNVVSAWRWRAMARWLGPRCRWPPACAGTFRPSA